MKRLFEITQWILIFIICLLPVGVGLSALFGYNFTLKSYPAFAIVSLTLAVGVFVLFILRRNDNEKAFPVSFFCIVTPVSVINAVLYMLDDIKNWYWISFVLLACTVVCFYFTVVSSAKKVSKIVSLITAGVIAVPVIFIGVFSVFLSLVFGDVGENQVVSRIENADKSYYAIVVSSDQGALGGDTFVNVFKKIEIDAVIFKVTDMPDTVYKGEFGEYEDMDIYWKDNRCLVINDEEYKIE